MIMSFRVAELQMLLGFAGKQKSGKKNELQVQALELLKGRSLTTSIQNKIKELHRQRYNNLSYLGNNSSDTLDSDYGHSMSLRSTTGGHHSVNQMTSQSSSNHQYSSTGIPSKSLYNNNSRTDHYGSMPRLGIDAYPPKSYQSLQSSQSLQFPVYPDVKFKGLPFYDILGELLKPSSLVPTVAGSRFQESNYSFHLTPQQANDVTMSRECLPGPKVDYTVQVQLRFCLNETTCEQEDNFPPSICVKINSKMCPLPNPLPTNKPGVEPKRPSRPVSITTLCKLSPTVANQISISWASDYNRPYAVGVFLVKKLTSQTLLDRIKRKGVRNADHTRALIKEKLSHDEDSEIATMSLRGSLLCPLGKMRIQIPCRAITCAHVQCFDALLYLQMNEKKPTWVCPVCDKSAVFSNLAIDGLFNEIMKEAPSTCNEVQFHEDGSWTPVQLKKENTCETLGSGSRKTTKRESSQERTEPKRPKIDIITIDSSDDDDDETIKDSSPRPALSTPVLSSGSGSESCGTPNHMQSLPSPDSSSSASSNLQPIASKSNTPNSLYFSSHNTSSPSSNGQSLSPAHNSNRSTLPSSLSIPSMTSMGRSTATSSPANPYSSVMNANNFYADLYVNSNSSMFSNYSNIDMSSAFDRLFRQTAENRERQNTRPNNSDPDIISID
ncbi:E3 SUMO-protein ligase PIAS2-like isoform X2 [Oppia nitens]|nr:E3 SUMO-protein ligase PIAS2-like isoform X2 [Oppia nitens]